MSADDQAGVERPAPVGRATTGRMGTRDLLFLAAGGVIGSGWMLSGTRVDGQAADWYAVGSWLIGGLLMLVVAVVMVELSIRAPKTGGLIFLPLQTGGPLLATVVAAGVWAYYAINPASEAAATVQTLSAWTGWDWLANTATQHLTGYGIVFAAGFLAIITAINLLGPRRFLVVNNWLTGFKILVPVLIVALLFLALRFPPVKLVHFPSGTHRSSSMLGAVVGSGVLYSYLGFQGPIDFAGNVRRGGIGEVARLRLAVYGTIVGSILLYTALQCVVIYLGYYRHSTGDVDQARAGEPSVYTTFVTAVVRPGNLASFLKQVINLDSVLSPLGTALVFTYVMTREVAALSRAHLTHRGLQRSENSVFAPRGLWRFMRRVAGDDQLDVYKRILWVDFGVCLIALVVTDGDWSTLQAISSVMALLVYATPSVTLAALCRDNPELFPRPYAYLSAFSFAALAVVFVLSTGSVQWDVGVLAVGCALLFGIPAVFPGARWYDARAHWSEFAPRENKAARLAAVLGGYFAVLALAQTIKTYRDHFRVHLWPSGTLWDIAGLCAVVMISLATFYWMVGLSAQYMRERREAGRPPLLPKPFPVLAEDPVLGGQLATETGS